MEEIEELKKNLKKELRASSSTSISRRKSLSASAAEQEESTEQKMTRVVKAFLDKNKVLDKDLPNLGPPTGHLTQNEVQFRIKQECRRLLWFRMSSDLFDQEELTALYVALEKYATPPPQNEAQLDDEKYIIYKDYKKLREDLEPRFRPLLSAKLFMRLITEDPYGRVPIISIFNYIMKKTWLKQTRLGLINYDFAGKGYITEDGMDAYLRELIPTLIQLQNMDPTFEQFYLCTVSRKFFFFLDPLRKGKIKITDILSSGMIDDILDLREKELREFNWFTLENTLRIYGQYLQLDKDQNGMLAKKEFMGFSHGNHRLTAAFVDRVYSECVTFSGEMDYRTYVDFNLAWENRNEAQSLQYFFRILDTNHKGYLDAFDLNFFFKEIEPELWKYTNDPVKFFDLKDELFDMVKPDDPLKITLKDLIKCGKGALIVRLLIDVNGILEHDNHDTNSMPSDMEPRASEV